MGEVRGHRPQYGPTQATPARWHTQAMPLEEYRRKRDFAKTPEPAPAATPGAAGPVRTGRFVIQRHRATRLHYDFRLEVAGVLVSWAVPKGLTLDPAVRRMAVHVEDHPIEYFDFEGVIPSKQYGAGDVIVWDWGTWESEAPTIDAATSIPDGELKFELHGQKLNGRFTIVRTSGRRRKGDDPAARAFEDDEGEQWLLIAKRGPTSVDGLGRRGPSAERQDRPNERRRQGRPRRAVDRPGAGSRRRDRPDRRGRRRRMPAAHRADAGDARDEALQRPRLAVRDQVGRLPPPGGRRRRQGPSLDPQPQRRRDLLPAAPHAADVDRCPRGDRRRRGRRAR